MAQLCASGLQREGLRGAGLVSKGHPRNLRTDQTKGHRPGLGEAATQPQHRPCPAPYRPKMVCFLSRYAQERKVMKLGKDGVVRESPRLPPCLPQRPQAKLPHGTVHCAQSQLGQTHGHGREADPPGLHPQPTGGKHRTPGTDVPGTHKLRNLAWKSRPGSRIR